MSIIPPCRVLKAKYPAPTMTAAASDPETRSWNQLRQRQTWADIVISIFRAERSRPAALTEAHLAYCSWVVLEIISVESKLVLMVCMCFLTCGWMVYIMQYRQALEEKCNSKHKESLKMTLFVVSELRIFKDLMSVCWQWGIRMQRPHIRPVGPAVKFQ